MQDAGLIQDSILIFSQVHKLLNDILNIIYFIQIANASKDTFHVSLTSFLEYNFIPMSKKSRRNWENFISALALETLYDSALKPFF